MDQIAKHDAIVFDIKFKLLEATRVSGTVVYIRQSLNGSFFVAIDFTGSKYGKGFKKHIEKRIELIQS